MFLLHFIVVAEAKNVLESSVTSQSSNNILKRNKLIYE